MKYPRLATWTYTPDSIHQWLQSELDSRGIDSTVYTRYVLSILQEDEDERDEGYTSSHSSQKLATPNKQPKQCPKHQNIKRIQNIYNNNGQNDNFRNGKWCECSSDDEDLSSEKKTAVIACLQSASEHCNDIESLVDQLQVKIREVRFEAWKNESQTEKVTRALDTQHKSSPQDVAKQYFAAFPALNLRSSTKLRTNVKDSNDEQAKKRNSWDGKRIIDVSKPIDEIDSIANDDIQTENTSDEVLHLESAIDNSFMDWELETLKSLERKFTSDVASIWEEGIDNSCNESKLSVWSYSSTSSPQIKKIWQVNNESISSDISSIWNEGLCSEPLLFESVAKELKNDTSLVNHGSNSLFVKVSPKPKSFDSDDEKKNFNLIERISYTENLLTSAATHFQPIKQDYYEKEVGVVIDPNVKGMVPCSPRCPNKQRKPALIGEQVVERSTSVSMIELESYIGPFADCGLPELPLSKDCLNVSEIIETFERKSNYSDKSTATDDSDDSNLNKNNTSERWERWLLNKDGECTQDFDTLCQLLDEVLRSHEKIIAVDKNNLTTNEYIPEKQYPEKGSMKSFAMVENHFLALQEEIKREEAEIFADINKTTEITSELFEDDEVYFDEASWQCSTLDYDGGCTNQTDWSSAGEPTYVPEGSLSKDAFEMSEYCNDSNICSESYEDRSQLIEFKIKRDQQSHYRKPCSFFLEGNCRRSDCKYSHDLKAITCKFWEEGSCFKGDSCPFLHGYDQMINRGSRRPSFTIESEKDFPSLAATDEFPELISGKVIDGIKKEKSESKASRTSGKKRKKGHQRCMEKSV